MRAIVRRKGNIAMYATVRRYAGNAELADKLVARKNEVIELMRSVDGQHAYYLLRAGEDTISVTLTADEAGARQSSELAAGWLRENMPDATSSEPEISAGELLISAR
jgi:hypothetical protein